MTGYTQGMSPLAAPASAPLDLSNEDRRPYFIWDEDLSIRQLRQKLAVGDREQWCYYAAKVMREARYEDVWKFLSLEEVQASWKELRPILGRKRDFWEFLFSVWKRHGIVS